MKPRKSPIFPIYISYIKSISNHHVDNNPIFPRIYIFDIKSISNNHIDSNPMFPRIYIFDIKSISNHHIDSIHFIIHPKDQSHLSDLTSIPVPVTSHVSGPITAILVRVTSQVFFLLSVCLGSLTMNTTL